MQEALERYLAQRGSVVTQLSLGRLVSESCGEARRKVQTAIREQLSQQGLSLNSHVDASGSERVRPREAVSGERVRPQGPGEGTAGIFSARGEPTPGGLLFKGSEPTLLANLTGTTAESTTGGLRKKAATEHTPTSAGRREGRPISSNRSEGGMQVQDSPLRLGGGVAPTARVGVALAGFGTLAVLILALGLATPQEPAPAPVSPNAAQPSAPRRPASIKLEAHALPLEASWYWDDQKLDSNPVKLSLPTDGAVHTLRAEAPGHKPFVKSVRLEADIDMTVVLSPE
jgi:hypothetical protein